MVDCSIPICSDECDKNNVTLSITDCTSEDVLRCKESEEIYNLLHISLVMDSKCWLITDFELLKFHYDDGFINLQFWPLSKNIFPWTTFQVHIA